MPDPKSPENTSQVAAMELGLSQYMPIPDSNDPAVEQIANAKKYAPDCDTYQPRIEGCIGAILDCRRALWDASDRRDELSNLLRPTIEQTAASMNPDERGPFFRSREIELTAMVKNEYSDTANRVADAAENALRDLEKALAEGRRRAEFSSLSIDDPADVEARVRLLEREFDTRDVAQVFDAFDAAVRSDDTETATLMVLATEGWARARLGMLPGQRQFEASRGAGAVGGTREGLIQKENLMLRKILSMASEWRVEQVDPSLVLASEVFAALLCPAYRAYVGMSGWDLPRPRLENAQLATWDERLDDWITRYMPFGRSDYATADATTIARRGGLDGPPGYGVRRKAKVGWERTKVANLVEQRALPVRVA